MLINAYMPPVEDCGRTGHLPGVNVCKSLHVKSFFPG